MNNTSDDNLAMTDERERIARIFKALGDANRLDIVMSIGRDMRSVSEIVKASGLSQTLVSFHLRILREANIVTTKRNGPFIFYRLSDPIINNMLLKLSISKNLRNGVAIDVYEPATVNNKAIRQRRK
jgi:DNA-binding transcriptional ArsR family regulator